MIEAPIWRAMPRSTGFSIYAFSERRPIPMRVRLKDIARARTRPGHFFLRRRHPSGTVRDRAYGRATSFHGRRNMDAHAIEKTLIAPTGRSHLVVQSGLEPQNWLQSASRPMPQSPTRNNDSVFIASLQWNVQRVPSQSQSGQSIRKEAAESRCCICGCWSKCRRACFLAVHRR
jgi:hypothetical protein